MEEGAVFGRPSARNDATHASVGRGGKGGFILVCEIDPYEPTPSAPPPPPLSARIVDGPERVRRAQGEQRYTVLAATYARDDGGVVAVPSAGMFSWPPSGPSSTSLSSGCTRRVSSGLGDPGEPMPPPYPLSTGTVLACGG
jgi:hypothetical protein